MSIASRPVFCLTLIVLAIARSAIGDDEILKDIAEYLKDDRNLRQIKLDNEMILAAASGNAQAVRQAISQGARVDSPYLDDMAFLDAGFTGYTALMLASRNGRLDAVKALIEAKADMELKRSGKSSLYTAVWFDRGAVVEMLAKAGAKEDAKKLCQTRDLLRAACRGYSEVNGDSSPPYPGVLRFVDGPTLEEVLNSGADVNSADSNGYTALMFAANLGLTENVKLLLAHEADPAIKSKHGSTAISLAEARTGKEPDDKFRVIHELLLAAKPEK